MGKSSGFSPMPDFSGIFAAQAAAQQFNLFNQLGQKALDWGKQQFESNKKQIQPIIDEMISGMKFQNNFAKEQKQFYDSTYKPVEADFAKKALNWDSPEREDREASMAGAAVAQQYAGARAAASQNLKDFGINPNAPRYAATDLATRLSGASANAAAQNTSRVNTQLTGMNLKQAAINTGRGYPGAISGTMAGGMNAGNSAVNNLLGLTASGANTMGTPGQYYGMGNQALGMWGSFANNNYSNYMNGYQFANQPQSQGWGTALGLLGGTALGMMKFEGGGAVPNEASPSQGTAVDDIPARLNAGEFIMPKEAVSWFGEKAMHDMILKAQKQRAEAEQESGAVPDVAPASPQSPTVVSRERPAAALPMG